MLLQRTSWLLSFVLDLELIFLILVFIIVIWNCFIGVDYTKELCGLLGMKGGLIGVMGVNDDDSPPCLGQNILRPRTLGYAIPPHPPTFPCLSYFVYLHGASFAESCGNWHLFNCYLSVVLRYSPATDTEGAHDARGFSQSSAAPLCDLCTPCLLGFCLSASPLLQ